MLKDRKKKEVVVTDLIGNLAAQCFGAKLLKNLQIVRREVEESRFGTLQESRAVLLSTRVEI